jgi:hypothetical protein
MTPVTVRRAFIALHLTLVVAVAVQGVSTLAHALSAHHGGHLAFVGAFQTAAALLFLWPRMLWVGGIALVAFFLVSGMDYALQGEFPAAQLVYAAAAFFVTAHGSGWSSAGRQAAA